MSSGLHNLVTDWGGFERFVAELHDGGDFEVQRNVVLPARSGATYEIDVLLTSRSGPYEYKTIISCKYWRSNVPRTEINDLIQAREQVGAHKAICFTSTGYQEPSAVAAARDAGIDLFVVSDLLPQDWGSPGKVIRIVLQLAQLGAQVIPLAPEPVAGTPPSDWLSTTPPHEIEVLQVDGTPDGTFGERAEKLASRAYSEISARNCLYNGGAELTFSEGVEFPKVPFAGGPRLVRHGGITARVENVLCQTVIRIHQSPIVIDRSRVFEFAVVVVDYLNSTRRIVSRRPGESPTWEPPKPTASSAPPPTTTPADVLRDTLLVSARLVTPLAHDDVVNFLANAQRV